MIIIITNPLDIGITFLCALELVIIGFKNITYVYVHVSYVSILTLTVDNKFYRL